MNPKFTLEHLDEFCNHIGDYEDFKKKVTQTFHKDYSIFAEKKSLIMQHPHFATLKDAVVKANEKLEGKTLSLCTTEQLEAFFKEVLKQTSGKNTSFSKFLFETNLSMRKTAKVFKASGQENVLIIISPFPRKYDDYGLVEDTGISPASLDELFERMKVYFQKSKGDLFGVIFTIDYAFIVWLDNYEPKNGLEPSQLSVFKISWFVSSLQSFIEDQTNVPLARINNLERFYVVFDFLSSILLQGETKEYIEL